MSTSMAVQRSQWKKSCHRRSMGIFVLLFGLCSDVRQIENRIEKCLAWNLAFDTIYFIYAGLLFSVPRNPSIPKCTLLSLCSYTLNLIITIPIENIM